MRYAIRLSYLGTSYSGWQKQPNGITVQEELEKMLAKVTRRKIDVLASGRTDAGVHSSDQLVHLDSEVEITQKEFSKINKVLPFDIALHKYALVEDDFHARFLATTRSYIYTIETKKNPFTLNQSYFFSYPLDIEKLNLASSYLLGKQDFKSFCKVKTEVNNYNCEITEAYWKLHGTKLCFYVTANRFLRGMVRSLVGTLVDIGANKRDPEWIKEVIASQNRSAAGRNVPPEGLSLVKVEYPTEFNWVEIN